MPEAGAVPLVLDTHVWIWVVEGERAQLAASAVDEIEMASERGEVLISAISVWEVGMLEAKDRIGLSQPLDQWIHNALRAPGAKLLPLTPDIAIESTRLPGSPHGDPADRILMASARVVGGSLVTRDKEIADYGEHDHVAIIDASP